MLGGIRPHGEFHGPWHRRQPQGSEGGSEVQHSSCQVSRGCWQQGIEDIQRVWSEDLGGGVLPTAHLVAAEPKKTHNKHTSRVIYCSSWMKLSISRNDCTFLALIVGCAVVLFSVCLIFLAILSILQRQELCHLYCMQWPCARLVCLVVLVSGNLSDPHSAAGRRKRWSFTQMCYK